MSNRIISLCLFGLSFFFLKCNDEEQEKFSAEPVITFKEISFKESSDHSYDSLKFTISYKDGDSDLGLDPASEEDNEYPYNQEFYFLEDGTGDTAKVYTSVIYESGRPYFLLNDSGTPGKVVTERTRLKPSYDYLPEYDPNSCLNYTYTELLVSEESNIINNSYNILDTLDYNSKVHYLIDEALLYQPNENYYNIFIEFYESDEGVNFSEYDWFEKFCVNFNGRFPLVRDNIGQFKSGPFKINAKTKRIGEITYGMSSPMFKAAFSNKTLKLKISIKDRALHTSNVIETEPFTLEGIK